MLRRERAIAEMHGWPEHVHDRLDLMLTAYLHGTRGAALTPGFRPFAVRRLGREA